MSENKLSERLYDKWLTSHHCEDLEESEISEVKALEDRVALLEDRIATRCNCKHCGKVIAGDIITILGFKFCSKECATLSAEGSQIGRG